MHAKTYVQLAALVTAVALTMLFVGCESGGSDDDNGGALGESYNGGTVTMARTGGTADPSSVTVTQTTVSFQQASSSAVGARADADAVAVYGNSDADPGFMFQGTFVRSAAGITCTLAASGGNLDGIARSLQLNLTSPDNSGNMTGTMLYTRGEQTYEGPMTLTPYAD